MDKPKEGVVVDGSCYNGNPGTIQWQAVDIATNELLFRTNPYMIGTSNVAEYLAIVNALQVTDETKMIYSDSWVAIGWIWNRKMPNNPSCTPIVKDIILQAHEWLIKNPLADRRIKKWQTKHWGENPADFNRK